MRDKVVGRENVLWINGEGEGQAKRMNRGEPVRALRRMCALMSLSFVCAFILFAAIPVSAHSTIHKAESNHQFTLEIYGNANEDDTIDMRDVTYIKLVIFGKKPSTEFCDANYDGRVSMLDVVQTKLIIVGKEGELTLRDCAKRVVTVSKPVKHVVSVSIDDLRTLCALGAVDKIVARSYYVDKYAETLIPVVAYPEIKEIPSVGSYTEPNLELIVSLEPDVIFMYGGSERYVDAANSVQEKTGIPVVCIYHRTEMGYDFSLRAFRIMGWVLGKEEQERAEELIAYTAEKVRELTDITSRIPESEKPRVYFFSAHRASFIERAIPCYQPIDIAGGINVAGELPTCSVTEVSIEQIIKWNPDIILVHCFSKEPKITVESILSDPRLQTVNAVKNKRVYYTKGFYIGWDPASGLAEAYYLAKIFHPDIFKDLDVEAVGNEIFKEFYGVDGLYTYILEYFGKYYIPEPE